MGTQECSGGGARRENGTIIRIHPRRTDLKQWWSRAVTHHTLLGAISVPVSFVLGIVCLGAFAVIFYRAAAYIPLPLPAGNAAPEKFTLIVSVLASTLIMSVAAAAFAVAIVSSFYALQWVEGEPFAWFDGLSIWPGLAIRIFAIILAIHFVVKSYVSLLNNDVEIFKRFSLRGNHHKFSVARMRNRRWLHAFAPWTRRDDKGSVNLDSALPFRDGSFDALELGANTSARLVVASPRPRCHPDAALPSWELVCLCCLRRRFWFLHGTKRHRKMVRPRLHGAAFHRRHFCHPLRGRCPLPECLLHPAVRQRIRPLAGRRAQEFWAGRLIEKGKDH